MNLFLSNENDCEVNTQSYNRTVMKMTVRLYDCVQSFSLER